MGATCGTLTCTGGKNGARNPRPNIIKRPTNNDLSIEDESEQLDDRIGAPPDA